MKISKSLKDEKRSRRQGEKKEKSTAEKAMDESTRVSLQKAINSGLVDSYGGIIATGKEAVVIHATGGTSKPEEFQDCLPAEMAVKGFLVIHFYIILEVIPDFTYQLSDLIALLFKFLIHSS